MSGHGEGALETVIVLGSGVSIRCPAHPAPCEYVMVCDAEGIEVAYWDAAEWAEAPVEVMGAFLGAARSTWGG
jgi:hypothetical protein